MTNPQGSRIGVRNNGNQAAAKKPFGNVNIRFIWKNPFITAKTTVLYAHHFYKLVPENQ